MRHSSAGRGTGGGERGNKRGAGGGPAILFGIPGMEDLPGLEGLGFGALYQSVEKLDEAGGCW